MILRTFVFFHNTQTIKKKHTHKKEKALSLKLVGWVQNTNRSTVIGIAQGEPSQIDKMKTWLKNEGSPQSKVKDAKFVENNVSQLDFKTFEIDRQSKHKGFNLFKQ